MTDQQTYTDPIDGARLKMFPFNGDHLSISTLRPLDAAGSSVVEIPAVELLAMIDRTTPDALRSYLRERSDLIDSPHDLDSVPEADSPEDVDELPTDETERRLHIIERLAKILRAGTDAVEVCTLADWVIDR